MNSAKDADQFQRELSGHRLADVVITRAQIEAMRQMLHELANIITGVMLASGLLSEYLQHTPAANSASALYGDCERGRRLVWELRNVLLGAREELQSASLNSGAAETAAADTRDRKQTKSLSASAGGNGEDQ
jgi:hypothetical protein